DLREVPQAHLRRGAGQAAPLRPPRRPRAPEPEALAAPRRALAVRDRARRPQQGAGEIPRAAHRLLDARRAGLAVGALERLARAAGAPAAGLVPPRRGERHPAPRGILPQAALLRRLTAGSRRKTRPRAGFLFPRALRGSISAHVPRPS